MDVLIAQLPALLGVIVGAIATFGFSNLTERAKWNRGQSTRWDEKRLIAYTEYAMAVKAVVNIAYRVGAARGFPSQATPIPPEEGLPRLSAAEAARSAKWETLLLLADPGTVTAARAWHECAWALEWFARGKLDGADEFTTAYREAGRARDAYYQAARASLVVGTGDLPTPPAEPEFMKRPRRSSGEA